MPSCLQAQLAHEALHRAPGHLDPFALQLPPYLPRAIDAKVLVPHATDLALQPRSAHHSAGSPRGIHLPGLVLVIGGRGDRQHRADRLDPVRVPIGVDELGHYFGRRSSAAWADN